MVTEKKLLGIESRGPLCERPEGFSLIELLVVIAVIAIVTATAVFQLTNTREAYNADDAANKVMSYLREANSRAVSDHHSFWVTINNSTNTISLIDEKTLASGNNEGETVSGDDVF